MVQQRPLVVTSGTNLLSVWCSSPVQDRWITRVSSRNSPSKTVCGKKSRPASRTRTAPPPSSIVWTASRRTAKPGGATTWTHNGGEGGLHVAYLFLCFCFIWFVDVSSHTGDDFNQRLSLQGRNDTLDSHFYIWACCQIYQKYSTLLINVSTSDV